MFRSEERNLIHQTLTANRCLGIENKTAKITKRQKRRNLTEAVTYSKTCLLDIVQTAEADAKGGRRQMNCQLLKTNQFFQRNSVLYPS